MTKGTLVKVSLGGWHRHHEPRQSMGTVMDYRPDVRGGTWMQSYKLDGVWHQEWASSPRRGEVLVLFFESGDMSWIDEEHVQPVQE